MRRRKLTAFLCIMLLGQAVFNLLGAANAYGQYAFISRLPLSTPPAYLLLSGMAWGLIHAVLAVGVWRRWAWARAGVLPAFALYAGQGWVNRLVLARADYSRATLGWALLVDAVSLGLVALAVARDRPQRGAGPPAAA